MIASPRPPRRDEQRRDRGPRDDNHRDQRNDKRGSGTQSFPDNRGRREQAYDPDSPFAALAALRNPKPE